MRFVPSKIPDKPKKIREQVKDEVIKKIETIKKKKWWRR